MQHHHFNGLKTAALFGGLWAILLTIGWFVARSTGSSIFIVVFALIGVATTFYGYWNSDTLAIRAMHAHPVSEAEAPAMYRIVRELSTAAGKPMPRLYISPTQAPNAFATGRNPENAAVCCTEGILGLLDERELRGVLGHELMHVHNRDILTGSVAAAIAGVISTIGQILSFGMIFGGGGGSDENRNPLAGLALAILAPFAAIVVQLAISRTREYDAAEDAARPPLWRRLVDQSTVWQRALGAVVAAITGVGVVVGAVQTILPLFDGGGAVAFQPGEVREIRTRTPTADAFVRLLVEADGTAVMLDHQVFGDLPGHGDVRLDYACDETTGCAQTRVQVANQTLSQVPGGIWLKGCYTVLMKGTGYGADPLDLELRTAGSVCPS